MSDERLIVGLGNPGEEYRYTRHNLGFLIIEYLASREKLRFRASRSNRGLVAAGPAAEVTCRLLLPMTFVNRSGESVKALVEEKEIALENILVVCDDLNLFFGEVRLRRQGSAGGHNGLKSITEFLGSNDFARLRVGIGAPASKAQAVDFVLGEFNRSEKKALDEVIPKAYECCMAWLTQGIEKAMRLYN